MASLGPTRTRTTIQSSGLGEESRFELGEVVVPPTPLPCPTVDPAASLDHRDETGVPCNEVPLDERCADGHGLVDGGKELGTAFGSLWQSTGPPRGSVATSPSRKVSTSRPTSSKPRGTTAPTHLRSRCGSTTADTRESIRCGSSRGTRARFGGVEHGGSEHRRPTIARNETNIPASQSRRAHSVASDGQVHAPIRREPQRHRSLSLGRSKTVDPRRKHSQRRKDDTAFGPESFSGTTKTPSLQRSRTRIDSA